ncbi:D-alanyl-D-alanine carboxypeptidase/D-alanyl-D-alanine-endopeptidase (penicillin-binding protein 4) [Microcella putealis]|uniref:D-alanyl-D-alanine carboxypeptidase/D-alanyl-D-alanine-endopeptidase (Penicillin-binding protein 4) n=1 Tax=Microcella putealis TaxID=337005 RepID=A0A4Q7LSK3_9MICO|nr:D-alanyl-D-alanine carboxypeptidase/D-alanyl-D-alanine-endopeptidase [Microcella putealis]RZS57332.1 D-alanyl-D-alanine carboxypeptidase/D-alanyl-D-alanine-endopeptidase (penicillin-binding protein 4) [Microcella putealis]TQM19525.1 D-alanyl-D-alanine carboxypeptidase/D-alanyl-D-alanine-endopeptidase (penicillin-binding protein 4) [Microcella putealis]
MTESSEPRTRRAARPPRQGFAGWVTRHRVAVTATALSLVFALLGTGAVFVGVAVGEDRASAAIVDAVAPDALAIPEPEPEPEPDPRPTPGDDTSASPLRTCTISTPAGDPRLGAFAGHVIDLETGDALFDRSGAVGQPAASGMKVLTAAAALASLGPNFRMSTRVVAGAEPGTVVLVGGGDVTLSALAPGQESVYVGAPKLADLAAQTVAAYAQANPDAPAITRVVLDSSYFPEADHWDSTWERRLMGQGFTAEVTALQVDGDRSNPRVQTSPRSQDPIGRAGQAFAQALAAAGNPGGQPAAIERGTASGGLQLAEVLSQPLSQLVQPMLRESDNSLAETIGRLISHHYGLGGTAASLTDAFTRALSTYSVATDGVLIRDASGLSFANEIPPAYLAQLFTVIERTPSMSEITAGLPVAGQTGTLRNRFTGANAAAAGAVTAKTGFITNVYTLSGLMTAADGSRLAFSLYALGPVNDSARPALDTLTTAIHACGNNLSNL